MSNHHPPIAGQKQPPTQPRLSQIPSPHPFTSHPPRPLRLVSAPRPPPPPPKPSPKPQPPLSSPPPAMPLRLSIPPPAPVARPQPLKLRVEMPSPSIPRRDRVPSLRLWTRHLLEEEFEESEESTKSRESIKAREAKAPRVKKPRAKKRVARTEEMSLANDATQNAAFVRMNPDETDFVDIRSDELDFVNDHAKETDAVDHSEETESANHFNQIHGDTHSKEIPAAHTDTNHTETLSSWSEKQTKELETAIRTVALPIENPLFWSQVSLRVSDHSAEECRQRSEALGLRPPQPKKQPKKRSQPRQQSNGLVAMELPRHR